MLHGFSPRFVVELQVDDDGVSAIQFRQQKSADMTGKLVAVYDIRIRKADVFSKDNEHPFVFS